jgi:hypothetical protein
MGNGWRTMNDGCEPAGDLEIDLERQSCGPSRRSRDKNFEVLSQLTAMRVSIPTHTHQPVITALSIATARPLPRYRSSTLYATSQRCGVRPLPASRFPEGPIDVEGVSPSPAGSDGIPGAGEVSGKMETSPAICPVWVSRTTPSGKTGTVGEGEGGG